MAKQVITRLIDDIDRSTAAETVDFGLDGRRYEIDLSGTNAEQLRANLAPYVEAARRVGGKRMRRPAGAARPTSATAPTKVPQQQRRAATGGRGIDPLQNKAIRAWARRNKIKISDRGRIPAKIMAQWEAAHQPAAAKG